MPEATVMITTHNSYHYLRRLLESMDYFDPGCEYDLFIADNASSDGTAMVLMNEFAKRKNFKRLHLSKDNLWDHLIYNMWLPSVLTDYVLFLNADVRVLKDNWLLSLIDEWQARPEFNHHAGLLGTYAKNCEAITPSACPKDLEWVRKTYGKHIDQDFDHLGHIHNSMFFADKEVFDLAGYFHLPRVLTDRHDNIASEIEFSVRVRERGGCLVDSKVIRSHFYHFGQKFPMKTYAEILQREISLKLTEVPV